MDKAAFSIIHVNRNKRETSLPFIAEPAASDDCLRDLFVSEKIHQDKKDKTPPAVICMEYDRDAKQPEERQVASRVFPRNIPARRMPDIR